eukprot:TRINITY_DN8682_c0_g1_i1.p1 TRINITY_DN8682_c0_g1~~TRINITY_DN8682_c0_g1_i1.p1  ORF type:complete len:324 (+),score=80.72 TRINITY_DN8682_c0_g1_i1:242-1213(+)
MEKETENATLEKTSSAASAESENATPHVRDIPAFVERTINFLYDKAEAMEGIFRMTGRTTAINSMKESLDRGKNVYYLDQTDLHSVAELLKMWFRDLPDPVLTYDLHQDFIETAKLENTAQRIAATKQVIDNLPFYNKCVFQHMAKLLRHVADHSATTKMTASNLGLIFGPSLLSVKMTTLTVLTKDMYKQSSDVIEFCIENYHELLLDIEKSRNMKREAQQRAFQERDEKVKAILGIGSAVDSQDSTDSKYNVPILGVVVKEGFMQMAKSSNHKKLKPRYFLLRYTTMSYFQEQKETTYPGPRRFVKIVVTAGHERLTISVP